MRHHRFESFAIGLDLDEDFERTLPPSANDDVLRAIAESRFGRDMAAQGGTYACFMAKHGDVDRAFPTVQLAARHLAMPEFFQLERMLEVSYTAQASFRDDIQLVERWLDLRVGTLVGGGQVFTWRMPATNGITYPIVSLTALFRVDDVVYTVGISGPDDATFGVAAAKALLAGALVDTSVTGVATLH